MLEIAKNTQRGTIIYAYGRFWHCDVRVSYTKDPLEDGFEFSRIAFATYCQGMSAICFGYDLQRMETEGLAALVSQPVPPVPDELPTCCPKHPAPTTDVGELIPA